MEIFKRFKEWLVVKQNIHENEHKPPYFKEKEIWWCSIGENVGIEINGKSSFFRRPVIILKKLDKYSFIGIPITSKNKIGSWYVQITNKDNNDIAIISQIRHFDYRRLDKKMSILNDRDFGKIRNGLLNLLNINPRKSGGRG